MLLLAVKQLLYTIGAAPRALYTLKTPTGPAQTAVRLQLPALVSSISYRKWARPVVTGRIALCNVS